MKNLNFGLTIALSLGMGLAVIPPIAADTTSDARKSIEMALLKMRVALNKRDAVGYTQFYAEDFVLVRRNGQKMNKSQTVSAVTQLLQQVKSVKVTGKIEKFVFSKDKATLNVSEIGTMLIPDPRGGKDAKVTMTSLEASVWSRTANGWKINQIKTLASKTLVDGKPVPQPQ